VGLPPAPLRDFLLKEGEQWRLVVNEANRVAAIRVVRKALGLSMEEAAAAAFRRFPVVYTGTRTEAEWLKTQMEASDVASQIAQSADGWQGIVWRLTTLLQGKGVNRP
jgi:hypothetical protein